MSSSWRTLFHESASGVSNKGQSQSKETSSKSVWFSIRIPHLELISLTSSRSKSSKITKLPDSSDLVKDGQFTDGRDSMADGRDQLEQPYEFRPKHLLDGMWWSFACVYGIIMIVIVALEWVTGKSMRMWTYQFRTLHARIIRTKF